MMTKADFDALTAHLNHALWQHGNDPLTVINCAMAVAMACQERSKGDFDLSRFLRGVANGTPVPLPERG